MDTFPVQEFKREIGYTDSPAGAAATEWVACEWPAPAQLPGLGEGWKVLYDEVLVEQGSGIRKIDLRHELEELSLEIFVSSTGPQAARERLVRIASSTMMPQIPYRKGPANLGDLSVVSVESDPVAVLFTVRNVMVRIRKQSAKLSVVSLAEHLASIAGREVVPQLAVLAPRLLRVDVNPSPAHVGQTVTVQLHPDPPDAGARWKTDFEIRSGGLQPGPQQGLTLRLRAVKPGPADVALYVIDRKTLVVTSTEAKVEVLEK